jgi:hypothetical protein
MRFVEAGNILVVKSAILYDSFFYIYILVHVARNGMQVNRTDNIGQTPLVEAITNRRFRLARILVDEFGADVNLATGLLRESPLSRVR